MIYSMSSKGENRRIELGSTDTERDLGVVVSADAKWHKHVSAISAKASSTLGWLKKAFLTRDPVVWSKLYTTYVRAPFEFAAPVWSPYSICDIKKLEKVQMAATKVTHEMKNREYKDRLEALGLTTLESRRERGDCIQMFKIANSIEKVKWHVGPKSATQTDRPERVGSRRLQREMVRNCQQRYHFFSNRIVRGWNRLPDRVIKPCSGTSKETVNGFKAKYDEFQHKVNCK